MNLPYGVWKTGYEKIYDFYITVNETSEKEQYYNILNNTLYAYLQVIKVDSETGKTIAIANTTFKILNTDTNQYVSQYVGGKVYIEFKTDENGKIIDILLYAVDGTKNLKDNIVSTKEKLKDNSNKNNNEENTIDYGSNAITGASSITASTIATQFNKNGKQSFKETRENIIKSKIKIKEFKDKQKAKRLAKDTIKTGKSTIKNSKMAIKTSKDTILKTQKNDQREC